MKRQPVWNPQVAKTDTTPANTQDPVVPVSQKTENDVPAKVTTDSNTPTYHSNTFSFPRGQEIKDMQQAMINLYDAFKSYPIFDKENDYQEKKFDHTEPFLSGLLNNYVNKSDIIGTEQPGVKNPSLLSSNNFANLLNSLRQVGGKQVSEGKIPVPDGVWGEYTNNALKNITALVSGIVSMMNNLKLPHQEYSDSDLAQLKSLVPESPHKISDPNGTAKVITKNLSSVRQLLGEFNTAINSEDSSLTPYIRQKKPFETSFSNAKLNKADQSVLDNSKIEPYELPGFKVSPTLSHSDPATIPISTSDLETQEGFDRWLKVNNIMVNGKNPLENPEAKKEVINRLTKQISEYIPAGTTSSDPGY